MISKKPRSDTIISDQKNLSSHKVIEKTMALFVSKMYSIYVSAFDTKVDQFYSIPENDL